MKRQLLRLPLLPLLVAAALAGCGSDDSGGGGDPLVVTETVTESTATGETTATGAVTETQPQTAGDAGDAGELTDSGIAPGEGGLVRFQTPSKNIGCVYSGDELCCDIAKHGWPSPPKPKSCDLDYGDSIILGGGVEPEFLCHGDTALRAGPVLAYGTFATLGDSRCESRESGLRCINGSDGSNGFKLSRESYSLQP